MNSLRRGLSVKWHQLHRITFYRSKLRNSFKAKHFQSSSFLIFSLILFLYSPFFSFLYYFPFLCLCAQFTWFSLVQTYRFLNSLIGGDTGTWYSRPYIHISFVSVRRSNFCLSPFMIETKD